MELVLHRREFDEQQTIGELEVDGAFECYTLEDPVQPPGVVVEGAMAIPVGRYQVILTESGRARAGTLWSPRADYQLPELVGVPGHTAIRIHAGNTAQDTVGCILVGQQRAHFHDLQHYDTITGSRVALTALMTKIQDAADRGEETWIDIRDER